jgi:DnaA family protein
MTTQLALNVRLRDGSSFDNFHPATNREAMEGLRRVLDESPASDPTTLFLWGETATGKSHLLQAACRFAQAHDRASLYVPLAEADVNPRLLEAADDFFVVCLDDAQRIAGDSPWESAVFALYELARASGTRLVVAATAAPMHLGLNMPELATRFAWGPVYQLHPLPDAEKLDAVRLRARNRGFELSPDVTRYILHRYPRDLHSLFELLERIDVASLANQRRVTIPFLRELEASRYAG